MSNPCMICLMWCIRSVAKLSRKFVGFDPHALDNFSVNFYKINSIHVWFLLFFLMWEIYLQNCFPILGYLCCITAWLIFTSPEGIKPVTHHLFWNQELGWTGELSLTPVESLGMAPGLESVVVDIQKGSSPISSFRKLKGSNCPQSRQVFRGMKDKRFLSPEKASVSEGESFNSGG